MKTLRLFATLFVVALCATFVSCGDDDEDNTSYDLIICETTSLNFDIEGGTKRFSFESNNEWIMSIHEEKNYKDSKWIEISSTKGKGGINEIEIKITSNNEEYEPRIAQLKIQSGVYVYEVSIKQNARNYSLQIETSGSLGTLLGSKTNQIGNLTLTGDLNGDDIKVIRNMAKLSILNVENANIVEGGDFYYSPFSGTYYYTENNKFPDYMFYTNQKQITSLILPNSITSIGEVALWAQDIKEITIPDKVTNIGKSAFGHCEKLESINIPNSIKNIGSEAFICCGNLKSITIPNSVTTINMRTFEDCRSLTSVIIGSGVKSIAEYAFLDCNELKEIHIKNPVPPTVNSNTFIFSGKKNCKLYIPKGSKKAYLASNWSAFEENIIEGDI